MLSNSHFELMAVRAYNATFERGYGPKNGL